MSDVLHLNFANGILPLAFLLLLAVAIPAVLAGRTLSQGRLAGAVGVALLVVWAVGAALMAWLYARINGGNFPGVLASLQRSAMMALLWGPVLALVWLMRAQGVERRRGLLMREDAHEAAD